MHAFTNRILWRGAIALSLCSATAQAVSHAPVPLQAEAAPAAPLSCRNHQHAGVRYHVTRLEVAGGYQSVPLGLNNFGIVAGYSVVGGSPKPTVWVGRKAHVLALLGGTYGKAYGVSDAGKVVGESTTPSDGINMRAVSWILGAVRDLGGLATVNNESFARAVNAYGLTGGASYAADRGFRPVIWRDGPRELPVDGRGFSMVSAINEAGVAVGYSTFGFSTSNYFGAVWHADGRVGLLAGPGGAQSQATDINNHGKVIGFSHDFRPLSWQDGRVTELPSLGGYSGAANGINDRDEIVGYSALPDGAIRGALWRDGRVFQLDTLLDDEGAGIAIGEAFAINRGGQITAMTTSWQPLLLTPRPCR